MRTSLFTTALAAICLTLPLSAQKLNAFSADGERAETRLGVASADFSKFAMVSVTYGQPGWKDEYEGMMDKLKGKMNRLGKDWFTTLINSAELEIGGTKLPPGSYIVGLWCDKDGKFSLAFMDSGKAMKEGVNPFMEWKPEFTAPLTLEKGSAPESVGKMTMSFAAEKDGEGKGKFTIAWGKHTLSAPVMLHVPMK